MNFSRKRDRLLQCRNRSPILRAVAAGGMTGGPDDTSVELRLAEAGGDLLPAIEAAQFARLVDHAEPADGSEAAAIDALVETFASAAEAWDDLSAAARSARLAKLGEALDELESMGLFVHWGRVTLMLDEAAGPRRLPLAMLSIDRSAAPVVAATIPGVVALEASPPTIH
jgi:hypothetical protein